MNVASGVTNKQIIPLSHLMLWQLCHPRFALKRARDSNIPRARCFARFHKEKKKKKIDNDNLSVSL